MLVITRHTIEKTTREYTIYPLISEFGISIINLNLSEDAFYQH